MLRYRLSFVLAMCVAAGLVYLYQTYSPIRSDFLLGFLIILPILGWIILLFVSHNRNRREDREKFKW